MRQEILSQETNYVKGLELAAGGRVRPNGREGQFYVNQIDFHGYLFEHTSSADWCNCPTWYEVGRKVQPVTRCEHMIAADIYQKAQSWIRAWLHINQSTLQHAIAVAHFHLEYASNDIVAEKYKALIAVARHMMVTDRHLSKMYPATLDQVQRQIERHQEAYAEIKSRLRRDPDNAVTREEIRYCRDALDQLKVRKARIVKGWEQS